MKACVGDKASCFVVDLVSKVYHDPTILRLASRPPWFSLSLPFSGFLNHTYRHMVGLLWTSDQPVAETSTYTGQHNI
jgi:hypothetical protein